MSKQSLHNPDEELKPGQYKGPDDFSADEESAERTMEGQRPFGTTDYGSTSEYKTGNTPQVASQERAQYQADLTEAREGFLNEGGMNQTGTGEGNGDTTKWRGGNDPSEARRSEQNDVKKQVTQVAKDAAGVAATQAQETLRFKKG